MPVISSNDKIDEIHNFLVKNTKLQYANEIKVQIFKK